MGKCLVELRQFWCYNLRVVGRWASLVATQVARTFPEDLTARNRRVTKASFFMPSVHPRLGDYPPSDKQACKKFHRTVRPHGSSCRMQIDSYSKWCLERVRARLLFVSDWMLTTPRCEALG